MFSSVRRIAPKYGTHFRYIARVSFYNQTFLTVDVSSDFEPPGGNKSAAVEQAPADDVSAAVEQAPADDVSAAVEQLAPADDETSPLHSRDPTDPPHPEEGTSLAAGTYI